MQNKIPINNWAPKALISLIGMVTVVGIATGHQVPSLEYSRATGAAALTIIAVVTAIASAFAAYNNKREDVTRGASHTARSAAASENLAETTSERIEDYAA